MLSACLHIISFNNFIVLLLMSELLINLIFILTTFVVCVNDALVTGRTLTRLIRQDYELKGHPALFNCETNENSARGRPFVIKNILIIAPKWSDAQEFNADPQLPLKYKWSYSMVKYVEKDGQATEEPFDISTYQLPGRSSINFPSYSLRPGFYKISPVAELKDSSQKLRPLSQNKCYLYVIGQTPVVVITGGSYRMVPSNVDIQLNGIESIDLNQPINQTNDVEYRWSCSQTRTAFCQKNPISSRPSFVIPSKYAIEGEKFNVTLLVTTADKLSGRTVQTIEVVKDAAKLEIRCEKNCPPVSDVSNFNYMTYLSVTCQLNCDGLRGEDYEWNIVSSVDGSDLQFDHAKNTQFGRTGRKFIILPSVLKPGRYTVSVNLRATFARPGKAATDLFYDEPPKAESCVTIPDAGVSLQTFFLLNCKQTNASESYFYELYIVKKKDPQSRDSDNLIMDGFYPEVFNTPFFLPPSEKHEYKVRISKEKGSWVEVQVFPKVESFLSGKSPKDTLKILKELYNGKTPDQSIFKMIASPDEQKREIAFQILQAFVNELVILKIDDTDFRDFIQDLKYSIAKDLMSAPMSSINEIIKMSDVITTLMAYDDLPESDPLLAKFATTICKKMMDKHMELLAKERFPLNFAQKVDKVSSILTRCFETNTNPKYSVLEPILYNFTTEVPVLQEPVITESYPDYRDFSDDYYRDIENLKESTHNIIHGTGMSAKAMAMTTAVGEKPVERLTNKSETIVAKGQGRRLARSEFRTQRVRLIPSKDFAKTNHSFDILMSTWNRDLMWWNPSQTRVATDIIHIQFWHSTCKKRVSDFTDPIRLFLDLKMNSTYYENSVKATVVIPDKFATMYHQDLNRHIKVRRIALPKRRILHVDFHNLSESDVFDVVVTTLKFPTIEDFAYNKTIRLGNDSFFVYINDADYDIWCYVGILPNREVLKSQAKTLTFSISFTALCCIRWKPVTNVWEPACMPGRENSHYVINCLCQHTSIIAGHVQRIESIDQELITAHIQLELVSCYVVFVTVAVTLALFCLLIILAVCKRKKEIYFLADNLIHHDYAYLVTVKTRNAYSAGTTSTVTIKLFGKKKTSLAHVLNHPDPKKRLLQRWCTDRFVLTTEHYLGDLLEIELWYDCTGPSPSWYCEAVEIYDMQLRQEWYFKVMTRLSLLQGNNSHVTVTSSPKEPNQKLCPSKLTMFNEFHTWSIWSGEEHFSFFKRLTVILSTVLTTYLVVLMFVGIPSLELKDSIDEHDRYEISGFCILVALIGSLVAFIIHITIAWIFRFSEIQFFRFRQEVTMSYNTTVACWVLLIILIVTSMTLLIVFGFWLPYYSSLIWLTSCLIGILINVVIYENLFLVVQKFFCTLNLVEKIDEKFDRILTMIKQERIALHELFGASLFRPYFEHLYTPLQPIQIKEKTLVVELRRNFYNELADIAMFTIYIIIMYVVILIHKDSNMVLSKNEIQSMFEGEHTRTLAFTSIKSVQQMYDYINDTLLPVMQPSMWYGNFVLSEPGLMIDYANKFIGVVRLRQQRMMTNVCKVPEKMQFLHTTCWPEFSMLYSETRTFGYGWGNFSSHLILDESRSIWEYRNQFKTQTLNYYGEFSIYSGGGYIVYLGRTLYNSYVNLHKMVRRFWIDQETRSVFIEFMTYNANYNVFNAVRLVFEQSATGYISNIIEVDAVRMLLNEGKMEMIRIIFFLLFIVWVVMLLLKQAIAIVTNFRTFYKDTWFAIDFVIILMSIICIVIFFMRMKMVGYYLNSLEKMKHNEFQNYFFLFYLEDFLTFFVAFLVLIATARLWKFLRFGLFFRITERTLSSARLPLLAVTFAFFVVIMAFALSGVLIFGNEFPELSSLMKIVATLITFSLKPDQFDLRDYTSFTMAYIYFAIYLLLMQIILFIYIIIIIMHYMKAQLEFSTVTETSGIKHYFLEQMQYLPVLLKQKIVRISGGQAEKKLVKSKSDEFRYANCLSIPLSSIQEMKLITRCVFRSMNKSGQRDRFKRGEVELMLEVCRQFVFNTYEEDEVELFFKGHFVGERFRVVDDKRIVQMAEVVESLLRKSDGESVVARDRSKNTVEECANLIKNNLKTLENCDLVLKLVLTRIDDVELGSDN